MAGSKAEVTALARPMTLQQLMLPQEKLRDLRNLILTLCVIPAAFVSYNAADHSGLIPHWARAQVKFPSNRWEVGEYQECVAGKPREGPTVIDCKTDFRDHDAPHEMDVTIWGNLDEPRVFNCQRALDSITCHLSNSNALGRSTAP